MKADLNELARLVNGKVTGNTKTEITGVSEIKNAKKGDIVFISSPKYAEEIGQTKASAILIKSPLENCSVPMLCQDNPLYAFSRILSFFYAKPYAPKGVHPQAIIGKDTILGKDLSIYPLATIGDRTKIGDRVSIFPGAYIGDDSEIEEDCVIYPNVSILGKIFIGKRVIIHSGTVIGSDGYGYVPYNGRHHKIPQVGEVHIEDDVEIGSNVSIDRATLGKTIIKRGTKIDNLVQIAHNVKIGEDCIIVAQCGISGSSKLGKKVILAGQVGVTDHVNIGENTLVGARTGVYKNVGPNQQIFGNPFLPYGKFLRTQAIITRLPEIKEQLKAYEKRLTDLETKLSKKTFNS